MRRVLWLPHGQRLHGKRRRGISPCCTPKPACRALLRRDSLKGNLPSLSAILNMTGLPAREADVK